nr:MAG TPA: hypothetical protein [Caudoviricetes sp.]
MPHLKGSPAMPEPAWIIPFIPVGHSCGTLQKCPR